VVDGRFVPRSIADFGLIPPARLGSFVAEARQQIGMSREAVALSSGGRLSVTDVTMLERGRLVCGENQLCAIEDVLGLRFGQTAPSRTRLVVDSEQGRLVLGGKVASFVPECSSDEILLRYLTLIYLCRRARPGTYIVPRSDDIQTLAQLLDLPELEIRQSLARLPYLERDVLRVAVRTASKRRVLPGLGLFVGLHQRGALLLVDPDTPSFETPQPPDGSEPGSPAPVVQFSAIQRRRNRTNS
jgi:hypothetical protein